MSDPEESGPLLRARERLRKAERPEPGMGMRLLRGLLGFFVCFVVTAVVWRMLCPG